MSSFVCMQRFLEDEYDVNGKIVKNSWVWPDRKPNKEELKTLMAIMLEISVSFFFDNFVYTFGGKEFLQCGGGPIGARLTMCMSRLTMQDWWEHFIKILEKSNLEYLMSALYVDDGRIIIEIIKQGVRFDEIERKFKFSEKWLKEDIESGKSDLFRTELEVRRAMNAVSPDLVFTTETEADFQNKRLPTLSFQIWSDETGIRHSFYEKEMRSQILTMKNSSQSEQSKYSILVNELTRRFEVLDSRIEISEKIEIIDHYTQQLVNSGYAYDQIRDIIESSLKGVKRKEERRKLAPKRYKSAEETIGERNVKKLTEATSWYREKETESEEKENALKRRNEKESSWNGWRKSNLKRKRNKGSIEVEGKKMLMSVLFVQHTPKSELAKRLRDRLSNLEKVGNLKFKVVEKTGTKLRKYFISLILGVTEIVAE